MLLTIEEIKSFEEIPVCPTVKGTVLDVSQIEQQNAGKGRFYAISAIDDIFYSYKLRHTGVQEQIKLVPFPLPYTMRSCMKKSSKN